MTSTAQGTFEVSSWDEKTFAEVGGGGKLTKASVKARLAGDISGEATTEWLMCYASENSATYVGFQKIEGTVGGRRGSFVVETNGTFDGTKARGTWSIVRGSGSGDLAGISGEGTFDSPRGTKASYTLEYELAAASAER